MQKGLVAGFLIGLGMALTGLLLSQALNNHTYYDRSITVKGLSERNVLADLGQWTLTFKTTGNNVQQASLVLE